MKKNVKTYALVILAIVTSLAIFDNLRISDTADVLKGEKEKLVEQVSSLEKEHENRSNSVVSLEQENKRLVGELTELEKEVEVLSSSVAYHDFLDAMNTVESYKEAKKFEEIYEFFLLTRGLGFGHSGVEPKCPCNISFNGRRLEWVPDVVQELKEFRAVGDKLYLTYRTKADIKHFNYQFVMAKGEGMFENKEEAWRIEVIEHIRK